MNKSEFIRLTDMMIETYGVRSYLNNDDVNDEEGDLFFECPNCGEPILLEDWLDDDELATGHCPICGERFNEA